MTTTLQELYDTLVQARAADVLRGVVVEAVALADGHVGVVGAVQQQQRRVNLVGVEERALLDVELAILPGEGVGQGAGAVVVTP